MGGHLGPVNRLSGICHVEKQIADTATSFVCKASRSQRFGPDGQQERAVDGADQHAEAAHLGGRALLQLGLGRLAFGGKLSRTGPTFL